LLPTPAPRIGRPLWRAAILPQRSDGRNPHTVLIPDSAEGHLEAAAHHERAAATHLRSAAFWEEQGDELRVQLHRDAAEHERQGAALERRWAALIEAERK
jgi:hypothetical protein